MKITKKSLKDIISEEVKNVVDLDEGAFDFFTKSHEDWADTAADIEDKSKSSTTAEPPSHLDMLKKNLQIDPAGQIERGLDKLLADFRNGILALLKPQMTEARRRKNSK